MLTQLTPNTPPPLEKRPYMQPTPVAQQQWEPEYNQQFVETLTQRLMPRLMPQILYELQNVEPIRARNRAFGMSLALAIVSLALMIPMTVLVLGMLTALGAGFVSALIALSLIGLVLVLVNAVFNYALFREKW